RRLFEKHAATAVEVRAAEDKVKQLELEIQNLQKRRAALAPTSPDLAAARARLREAQIAVTAARKRAVRSVITAPMSGVISGIAARRGASVEAGALIANIGRLDRLRVRVYVDEPELGRVSLGQSVTIRWQALPGKQWQGMVERKPVSIQPLGSR